MQYCLTSCQAPSHLSRNWVALKCIRRGVCRAAPSPDLSRSVFFFIHEVIPQTFPSRLRQLLCKYCKHCVVFISKRSYCRYLSTEISSGQLSLSMRISKSSIAPTIKETICGIWTALQAQHTPSPNRINILKIARDIKYSLQFPKCIESTDEKHMRIHCQPNSGSQYFNYKQWHSIVLQAVVERRS